MRKPGGGDEGVIGDEEKIRAQLAEDARAFGQQVCKPFFECLFFRNLEN